MGGRFFCARSDRRLTGLFQQYRPIAAMRARLDIARPVISHVIPVRVIRLTGRAFRAVFHYGPPLRHRRIIMRRDGVVVVLIGVIMTTETEAVIVTRVVVRGRRIIIVVKIILVSSRSILM